MTNLYDSSPKKKNRLIIIHGMNNGKDSFTPLINTFLSFGWDTHFLTLPCHGEDRFEAIDFKQSLTCFNRSMSELAQGEYAVIAFSQGGLYLQHWLENHPENLPQAQVLLAPALAIHRFRLAKVFFNIVPSFIFIKSLSPANLRRHQILYIRDYRILLSGVSLWHKIRGKMKVPTLLLIDPKDELVDGKAIEKSFGPQDELSFEYWPRDYLKKGLGRHHILFHPFYFSESDWHNFITRIHTFLDAKFTGPEV